jgi:pimeloyl-ACP methyl ester carboxylesterase
MLGPVKFRDLDRPVLVSLEALVPADPFYRGLDAALDLSFIRDWVAGFRVLAPDQRGFGQSDRPEGVEEYQFDKLLGDVLGLLDQAGVERTHVVGHDWGASVAWALAAFAPTRMARLVALSVSHPATYFGSIRQYEKSWYMLLFHLGGIAEQALQKDNWRLMRGWLGGAKDLEAYIDDLSRPGALTAGLNWYRANVNLERMFRLAERTPWPPIQVPTLGIWSAGDRYCEEQGFLDVGPYITGPYRYERIEDARHWIPLDQPERLNDLLLEFLTLPG